MIIHDERGRTDIEDMGLDCALDYYNWNVFNMQEGTGPHRTKTPQCVADERREAHKALLEHIRGRIPNAKLYYQEIWSYDIGGGQYLNACVWFETLSGLSCLGNTFRPDYELSETLIEVLQQAAHEAVAQYRSAGNHTIKTV